MPNLKISTCVLFFFISFFCYAQPSIQETEFIKVDQFGYLPNTEKVAVISNPQVGFNSGQSYSAGATYQVREWTSGTVVFSGSPVSWNGGATHAQSGDQGWWFDFSSVTAPGSYYIVDMANNLRSSQFLIDQGVYNNVLKAACRMFYYNRCNIEKVTPYAESNWTDATSFENNLQDGNARYVFAKQDASTEKDLSGGWYDAGDFNKYVTFVDRVMHDLLWAYQENPGAFDDNWNIPESGNGIPDIIDELKWELDWLLKMNNPDGSTHLKMGSQNYSDNTQVPPSANTDPRYYGPTCTSASISVAGVFAHAAKVFSSFPSMSSYAQQLETRAVNSWAYVLPLINANQLQTACDNGEIISGDADWNVSEQQDKALKAAIYLFDLTGDVAYNQYTIANAGNTEQLSGFWGPYKMPLNDALLLYSTLNGADAAISGNIRSTLTNESGGTSDFYGFNPADLYRSQMPSYSYHWGSNLPKAATGVLNNLCINYNINPANHGSYEIKANEVAHYFHGVNPMALTYLTNMYGYGAERCVNEIYHQWFNDGTAWDNTLTSQYGPAPGYVPGGPNKDFSIPTIAPPSGQPAQKSYLDFNTGFPDASWEISEPAIYYQSAYIRMLASLIPAGACPTAGSPCNDNDPSTGNDVEDGNCNCAGTPCPAAGTVCDDNNPNTINDAEDGNCGCNGTQVDCELLENESFDVDLTPWYPFSNTTATAIPGAVVISTVVAGNPWDAGFAQNGLTIEQGSSYSVTFRASATANRAMALKISQPVTPFTGYTFQTVNLTPVMQTFTLTFAMTEPTDNAANFEFQIGESTEDVTIEFASIMEVGCSTCPALGTICDDSDPSTINDEEDGNCHCTGTSCPAAGGSCDDNDANTTNDTENGFCFCTGTYTPGACEEVTNGTFNTDFTGWNSWGCTPETFGGIGALEEVIPGVNTWDAGIINGPVNIELTRSYTLTFRAKAEADRTVDVKVGQPAAPFTSYLFETVNLTTVMQTFTYTFTMANPSDPNATLDFLIGGNASSIYFDYVSLEDNNCGACTAAGTPCDDNDPSTFNDVEDGNCTCAGTPCPLAGTTCDDGNPSTTNDTEDGNCNCTGTFNPGACEQMINGAFDNDVSSWDQWNCTPSSVAGIANITGIIPGSFSWDAGFFQPNLSLDLGTNYTVSFRAKADVARTIDLKLDETALGVTYHYEVINLTTTMQDYTINFTMTEATVSTANLYFFVGGNASSVYFDYVSLQETNCAGCPAAGTVCDDNDPNTTNDTEDGNCNCTGDPCIDFNVFAFLEGAYDEATGVMRNNLNTQRQLLPGMVQNPLEDGHPYSIAPWNYAGTEGQGWSDAEYDVDAVDWVLISLRTGPAKSTEVFRAAGLLMKDGSVLWTEDCRLFGLTGNEYYVVFEHRNHIAAMSPQPVPLVGGSLTYDFRSNDSYAVTGFGQKSITPGVFVLFVGDVDQITDQGSYDINASDKAVFDIENGEFNQYLPSDFDQNGDVNGADKILWNSNNGVFSSVPK